MVYDRMHIESFWLCCIWALSMIDVPCFIKKHLWMSASDETTLIKCFGGRKPSSKLTLKTKWFHISQCALGSSPSLWLEVQPPQQKGGGKDGGYTLWICGCFDNSQSCEQLKKHVTDKYFEKKLDFEPSSTFITGNVCFHYNTWVTGFYMAYMFDRNSGRKTSQTEWLTESNLRSFG